MKIIRRQALLTMLLSILLTSSLLLTACQSTKNGDENKNAAPSGTNTGSTNTAANEEPSENTATPTPEALGSLTFGILPAESAIPIILAKEKGFFEAEGLSVTIQSFSAPTDRNVAVQAKELDGVIGDVMTEAAFYENGLKLKITSDINEDFKILSSPGSGITDMKGLKGKKVSLVKNFILEYIMDKFAEENGFTYDIVEIPSFSGRSEALMSNQIDGVVFTEPQASMLVAQGAHLLGSSKEAGIKGGTLLFTEEAISEKPDSIKAFYRAYNKAVDYMNTTKSSEFVSILTNYQFPEAIGTYLDNLKKAYQPAGVIKQEQFDDIIKWSKNKGQITKAYTYEDLTDFSFLPQ